MGKGSQSKMYNQGIRAMTAKLGILNWALGEHAAIWKDVVEQYLKRNGNDLLKTVMEWHTDQTAQNHPYSNLWDGLITKLNKAIENLNNDNPHVVAPEKAYAASGDRPRAHMQAFSHLGPDAFAAFFNSPGATPLSSGPEFDAYQMMFDPPLQMPPGSFPMAPTPTGSSLNGPPPLQHPPIPKAFATPTAPGLTPLAPGIMHPQAYKLGWASASGGPATFFGHPKPASPLVAPPAQSPAQSSLQGLTEAQLAGQLKHIQKLTQETQKKAQQAAQHLQQQHPPPDPWGPKSVNPIDMPAFHVLYPQPIAQGSNQPATSWKTAYPMPTYSGSLPNPPPFWTPYGYPVPAHSPQSHPPPQSSSSAQSGPAPAAPVNPSAQPGPSSAPSNPNAHTLQTHGLVYPAEAWPFIDDEFDDFDENVDTWYGDLEDDEDVVLEHQE